jgi:hypothetical protein
MDWFERITGFAEKDYAGTQGLLQVKDGRLVSAHSLRRYSVGRLEWPTLAELRERTAGLQADVPSSVDVLTGDVRALHGRDESARALFQVASQFNLLEMIGPSVTPEEGVSGYAHDSTQGPACAMAAGAATIYRNYLVPLAGGVGQTAARQIDCLADLGAALGNEQGRLWRMQNGYALFSESGLAEVDARLAAIDEAERDRLKSLLRIGLHWHVDVTDREQPGHTVSQAFCSALPVGYHRALARDPRWERIATLVLEAAYEATLRGALLHDLYGGTSIVYLTLLGGGAFGNDRRWILQAIRVAIDKVPSPIVRIVSYRQPEPELLRLARRRM